VALTADHATGLLRLALPAGVTDLAVVRTATAPERAGWAVSAAGLMLWLGLNLFAWRSTWLAGAAAPPARRATVRGAHLP
jgi:hypothetical protein